jgi:PhnB protein
MKLEPYLFFDGDAEDALDFYERCLGATVEGKMRYGESPDPVPVKYLPPGGPQKLLHASLLIQGQRVMLSDGLPIDGGGFRGFALCLQYDQEADARSAFDGLSEGGSIVMPMGPTFFSPCFGHLVDRFGIQWMAMVSTPIPPEGTLPCPMT